MFYSLRAWVHLFPALEVKSTAVVKIKHNFLVGRKKIEQQKKEIEKERKEWKKQLKEADTKAEKTIVVAKKVMFHIFGNFFSTLMQYTPYIPDRSEVRKSPY